jgi:DNA adenine methylase
LVYFDPPYTLAHANNGFIKYNQNLFSWQDQQTLADLAERLRNRSCFVIVSNATHPSISALYPGFQELRITRPSRIAASSLARKQVTESLFLSWKELVVA